MLKHLTGILVLVFVCLRTALGLCDYSVVKIGVLANRGAEKCYEEWNATADYLTQTIPKHLFRIVPLGFKEIEKAAADNNVDFMIVNSAIYVDLEYRFRAVRIATLVNNVLGKSMTYFGGVIFTGSDQTGINDISDLAGKKIAAADMKSLGGWLSVAAELKKSGIDPYKDLHFIFVGTHDQAVYSVLNKEADAGFVRTDVIENLIADGRIPSHRIRIIADRKKAPNPPDFPFFLSTELYPEWPIAKMRTTSDDLARKVTASLLTMPKDSKAARSAKVDGWTIPLNYENVHQMLKLLNAPPYDEIKDFSFADVFDKYRVQVILLGVVFILLTSSTVVFIILSRRIAKTGNRLALELLERRKAQDALKESEKRYRSLVDNLTDGLIIHRDGIIRYVNPSAARMFGAASESELIGRPVLDMVAEPFRDIVAERMKQLYENNDVPQIEEKLLRLDGSRFYCEVGASPITYEGRIATQVTIHDISHKKFTLEILRSRIHLGQVANQLTLDDVIEELINEAERLTDSSIGFYHFVEADEASLILQNWSKNTAKNCTVMAKGAHYPLENAGVWCDALRERKPIIHNNYLGLPNKRGLPSGHVPLSRMVVVPVFVSGSIVALLGVGNKDIDYTEEDANALNELAQLTWEVILRKRIQDDLLKSKEAAEAASRVKSDFLAIISHEVRTPLNGVLGMLYLLNSSDLTDEQRECVETALFSSRSLLQILNDILDITRIEAGTMTISQEYFDINSVIEPVIGALKEEAMRKQLDFSSEIDQRLSQAMIGDSLRIRQILFNLVGNAIKYTEEGSVKLEVYPLPFAPSPDILYLHFAVIDTGIGIPDDKISHVFGLFNQVDGSFTRKYGGTGLGLTIVKRLTDLMNGSIHICTEVGVGTEVHVTLPVRLYELEYETYTDVAVQPEEERKPCARTILVVEDETVNRMALTKYLTRMGCTTFEATNGLHALEMLEERQFDAILMDIQMPVMDGVEAVKRIREGNKPYCDIPIIAITAHTSKGDMDKYLDLRIDDCLTKPFELNELETALKKLRA